MSDRQTTNHMSTATRELTKCWSVPDGGRRWHVSTDGNRYDCGAWVNTPDINQMQDIRWPDFPVLACIKCVRALRRTERLWRAELLA